MTEKPKSGPLAEAVFNNDAQDALFQAKTEAKRDKTDIDGANRIIAKLIKEGEIAPSSTVSELMWALNRELERLRGIKDL